MFSDPVDLNISPDDVVSAESEIRADSVVVFERRGENQVVIRSLSTDQARDYSGSKYTVARGDSPGDIKFSLWRE
jgi:hypothetical protein